MTHLQNQSPISQGTITAYKNLKNEKPYLGYLYIYRCRVLIHIPKEKRKKLDNQSYQGIYVGYKNTNQYCVYDPHNGQVSITRDVHFDKTHHYDSQDLKSQEFVDDEWYKKDDKLFVDPTDILDASKSILVFNIIPYKNNMTYPYPDESRGSSPLSDIPDLVGDKEHYEEENATFEDIQLRKKTEKESRLQLNRGDRDSSI